LTLVAALIAAGSIYGCSEDAGPGGVENEGGATQTGGSKGKGGSGGSSAKGGASGSGGISHTDASGSDLSSDDAAESTDAPEGADGDAVDTGASETGGAGPSTGGTSGSDAGKPAVASCSTQVSGLTTCRQLEVACENCPPGGAPEKNPTADECFKLTDRAFAGQATDADCAKFAMEKKCTVDPGGNICVTLNCDGRPGCDGNPDDRKTCAGAAHYGEKADCQKYLPKCSCK
jgi:hypothetical protein